MFDLFIIRKGIIFVMVVNFNLYVMINLKEEIIDNKDVKMLVKVKFI